MARGRSEILGELEAKQANLGETLLRISGAIQVLEEVLGEASEVDGFEADSLDRSSEATFHPQTDVLA